MNQTIKFRQQLVYHIVLMELWQIFQLVELICSFNQDSKPKSEDLDTVYIDGNPTFEFSKYEPLRNNRYSYPTRRQISQTSIVLAVKPRSILESSRCALPDFGSTSIQSSNRTGLIGKRNHWIHLHPTNGFAILK